MNREEFFNSIKKNNIDYSVFEQYINKGDSILDYQAGYGRDSLYFNEDYDVTAVNHDASLAANLSKDVLKSFCVDVREAHFMNRFHAIWVYESFNNHGLEDLSEILDTMYIALKKDGVIQVNLNQDKIDEFNFDQLIKDKKFVVVKKNEVKRTDLVSSALNYRYILRRGSLLSK
jgi:hypothetical protein